nr:hypothetical protein [Tanacetum cinerariifolium]
MVVQSELGEGSAMPTDPYHTPTILQSSSSQPQKTHKPRKPTRQVTQVSQPSDPMEHVADEAVHKELGDSLVRAATTASSLEADQDNGGGPRCQETIGDSTAQTRVLELEKTKTSQHNEIVSLKRRVEKLKKRNRSRTHKLKRLYKVGLTARVESSDNEEIFGEDASKQGMIEAINADEDITLVNDQDEIDKDMFDVNVLGVEEVFAVAGQNENVVNITSKELTLAQALEALKLQNPRDRLDEKAAKRLQAEFDEEERLAKEQAEKEQEANIALIETRDIQAKIDADYQMAERLQAQEQEELSNAEKATLFQQLLEKEESTLQLKEQKRKGTNHQHELNKERSRVLT